MSELNNRCVNQIGLMANSNHVQVTDQSCQRTPTHPPTHPPMHTHTHTHTQMYMYTNLERVVRKGSKDKRGCGVGQTNHSKRRHNWSGLKQVRMVTNLKLKKKKTNINIMDINFYNTNITGTKLHVHVL